MLKVAVVGAGKVGTATAVLLQQNGFNIVGVAGKTLQNVEKVSERLRVTGTNLPQDITKEADIIFITTPDREIERVCMDIRANDGFNPGQTVIHMSGALPASILQAAGEAGAYILSLHPLQSFADVEQAIKNLPGSFFSLEGDEEAVPIGIEIVDSLKGSYFQLDSSLKPLYHAGAAVASNFLVAVLHWAIQTYQQLGITEEQAINAIWPLVVGTLNNVKTLGPVEALTGPIARGDVSTVDKHLNVLIENQRQNVDVYKALGLYTSQIAWEKGSIDENVLKDLTQLLSEDSNSK